MEYSDYIEHLNYAAEKCCSFAGHRSLTKENWKHIRDFAEQRICNLYGRGVRCFFLGGSAGFEAMAVQLLFQLRDSTLPDIKIILFGIRAKDSDRGMTKEQRSEYLRLYGNYDTVVRNNVSSQERYRRMVNNAQYCIVYVTKKESGSYATMQYAKEQGRIVYNLADKGKKPLKGKRLKIISWNLNGLLSCLESHSFEPIKQIAPDVLCCQEIRTKQKKTVIREYKHYLNPSERDGFHGTMTLARQEPIKTHNGIGVKELDAEGRVITLEYPNVYIVNAYAPMSQKNLERQDVRREWDYAFRQYICSLDSEKPVIMCGDFNVARLEIDVFPENMRQHWDRQGYASDEAANIETLLELGFVDAFRELYPDKENCYTWWSNRLNRRAVNRGWRLDYFFISERLRPRIIDVRHLTEITGSDHCPIELIIKL